MLKKIKSIRTVLNLIIFASLCVTAWDLSLVRSVNW